MSKTYTVAVSSTVTQYSTVEAASWEEAAEHPDVDFPSTCHQCPKCSGEAFAIHVYGEGLGAGGVTVFDYWENLQDKVAALNAAIAILERGEDLTKPDADRSPEGLILDALKILRGDK